MISYKIFVICVLSLKIYVQASYIAEIEDVRIEQTDDKFLCGSTFCPLMAVRCFVSKSNERHPSVEERVNMCFSKDNKILEKTVFLSKADGNSKIATQITATREGNVVATNIENFDAETFNKNYNYTENKSFEIGNN